MNTDSKTLRKERVRKNYPNLVKIGDEIEQTVAQLHQEIQKETLELKKLIDDFGLNQNHLAEYAGMSKQAFSNSLNFRETKKGYPSRFSVSQLNKINEFILRLSESAKAHYDKWK